MKYFMFLIFTTPSFVYSQTITRIQSVQSVYIELFRDNIHLSSATGFVIQSKSQYYLVTNWHVVANKNPKTKQWLDTNMKISPNKIAIVHNAKTLGKYVIGTERLLDQNNNHLWYENSIGNEMVDVVEIPLKDTNKAKIYPVEYKNQYFDSVFVLRPMDNVFILGFPLAMHSEPFMPIWKSGTVASEPDLDQEGKPIVWIDASTFHGMSGSPVYYIGNQFVDKHGTNTMVGYISIFLGVFSHGNNVVNSFWKASYLKNIFDKLP